MADTYWRDRALAAEEKIDELITARKRYHGMLKELEEEQERGGR